MKYICRTGMWAILVIGLFSLPVDVLGANGSCEGFITFSPQGPFKVGDRVMVRVTLSGDAAESVDKVVLYAPYGPIGGGRREMTYLDPGIWEEEVEIGIPKDQGVFEFRAYVGKSQEAQCQGEKLIELVTPEQMSIQVDCPPLAEPDTVSYYRVRILGGTPPYTIHWDLAGDTRKATAGRGAPTASIVDRRWMKSGEKDVKVEVTSGTWFWPEKKSANCMTRVVSDRLGLRIEGPATLQVGETGQWTITTNWESGLQPSEHAFEYTFYWEHGKTTRYSREGREIQKDYAFERPDEYVVDVMVYEVEHRYLGQGRFTVKVVERQPPKLAIDGPTRLQAGDEGVWTLRVSGAPGPHEFVIKVQGRSGGRSTRQHSDKGFLEYRNRFNQAGRYWISVEAADRQGANISAALSVEVSKAAVAAADEGGFQIGETETRRAAPVVRDGPSMVEATPSYPEEPLLADAPEEEWGIGETETRHADDDKQREDDVPRRPGGRGDGGGRRRPPRTPPTRTRVVGPSSAPYHIFAACSRLGWAGGLARYTDGASDQDIREHLVIAGEHAQAAYDTSNEPIRAWPDWRAIQDKFNGMGSQLIRNPTRTARRQLAASITQSPGPLANRLAYQMAGEKIAAENCDSYYCRIGYQMANGQQLLELAEQAALNGNDRARRNAERDGLDSIRQANNSLRGLANVKLASGACANLSDIDRQLTSITRRGSTAQRAQTATNAWQETLDRLLALQATPPLIARQPGQTPPPPGPSVAPAQPTLPPAQAVADPGELAGVWSESYGYRASDFGEFGQSEANQVEVDVSVRFVKDGNDYVGYKVTGWESIRNQTKWVDFVKLEVTYGRHLEPETEIYRLRRTGSNTYAGEALMVASNRGLQWIETEIVVHGDYAEERFWGRRKSKLGFEREPLSPNSCIRKACYHSCLDFGDWRGSMTDPKCKECQRRAAGTIEACVSSGDFERRRSPGTKEKRRGLLGVDPEN